MLPISPIADHPNRCPNCGSPIRRESRLCRPCYDASRLPDKLDRDVTIYRQLQTRTERDVAQEHGISQNRVNVIRHRVMDLLTLERIRLTQDGWERVP